MKYEGGALNPLKLSVRDYWDSNSCGTKLIPQDTLSSEFFPLHSKFRDQLEPGVEEFAQFRSWAGGRVVEIGVGIGAHFVRFRKAGVGAVGLDLSYRSLQLARQNALVNGVDAPLLNADAESLPFADNTFDLVYSWGVLHHTSDTDQALREIHRCLRPGDSVGLCCITGGHSCHCRYTFATVSGAFGRLRRSQSCFASILRAPARRPIRSAKRSRCSGSFGKSELARWSHPGICASVVGGLLRVGCTAWSPAGLAGFC